MATSTKTKDYLGRLLQNSTPGTTDPVKGFLGRECTATKDWLGRDLVA